MNELILTGWRGQNPLHVLASFGVLAQLEDAGVPAKLGWRPGLWEPVVACQLEVPELPVTAALDRALCQDARLDDRTNRLHAEPRAYGNIHIGGSRRCHPKAVPHRNGGAG